MIVASLLLILVAVTMLVLGLAGGASSLLISSIVASLLAAVALVIGARQTAAARRGAEGEAPSDPAAPVFAGPAMPAGAAYPRPATDDPAPAVGPLAADSASSARDTVQFDPVVASPADEAFESGRHDAAAGMTAGASGARRDDAEDDAEEDLAGEAEPDYERAAEAINAARNANREEHAWRRAGGTGHAEAAGLPDQAVGAGAAVSGAAASGSAVSGGAVSGGAASGQAVSGAAASRAADEFADPDDGDPDDEPLPQAVRPADAVRVARMDAEVLVVDGRPRYHLPDCAHLIGRLTEPIPVDEAVELGFSPCGLCRPVDRLVTAAARY